MSMPGHSQQPSTEASSSDVPLWAPYYGASVTVAVSRFFSKYATFSGRASRSEFWWWYLISSLVSVLYAGFGSMTSAEGFQPGLVSSVLAIVGVVFGLAVVLPFIALSARRLHDSNLSGWWYLLNFIPFVGWIIFLVLAALPPNPAGRRYDRPDDRPTPTNNRGPAFR